MGESIDFTHPCHLVYHVALLDVLPRGMLTFFAGTERCVRQVKFASIHNHKLVFNDVRISVFQMYFSRYVGTELIMFCFTENVQFSAWPSLAQTKFCRPTW
jgi:hypothetical protein